MGSSIFWVFLLWIVLTTCFAFSRSSAAACTVRTSSVISPFASTVVDPIPQMVSLFFLIHNRTCTHWNRLTELQWLFCLLVFSRNIYDWKLWCQPVRWQTLLCGPWWFCFQLHKLLLHTKVLLRVPVFTEVLQWLCLHEPVQTVIHQLTLIPRWEQDRWGGIRNKSIITVKHLKLFVEMISPITNTHLFYQSLPTTNHNYYP